MKPRFLRELADSKSGSKKCVTWVQTSKYMWRNSECATQKEATLATGYFELKALENTKYQKNTLTFLLFLKSRRWNSHMRDGLPISEGKVTFFFYFWKSNILILKGKKLRKNSTQTGLFKNNYLPFSLPINCSNLSKSPPFVPLNIKAS